MLVEEEGASCFQHLSQLQLLTRLCYRGSPATRSMPFHLPCAFADAVGGLPGLRELDLQEWSLDFPSQQAIWHALMQSLSKLTQVSLLRLQDLQLDERHSAACLPALASSLRSLRSLSYLEIAGDHSGIMALDNACLGAGRALVAAIGTLTQLTTLALYSLDVVSVRDCCRQFAQLTQLKRLHLQLRKPTEVAPAGQQGALLDAALPPGGAAETTFMHAPPFWLDTIAHNLPVQRRLSRPRCHASLLHCCSHSCEPAAAAHGR